MELEMVDRIVDRYDARSSALLAILQDIQQEANYLPQAALRQVARRLDIPLTRVVRMATFYAAFSLKPRGRFVCNVCLGTACHVRGAGRVLDQFQRTLGIGVGETTDDGLFTLQTVNCVGACALGPVVVVGEQYHREMNNRKVDRMLKSYRKQAGE
ncbi:MAG: NAD(P)H-dependent oxidoreductase subunit E [Bradymonadales bacterium]|nr:NAD(P)H-dependent oxidoreductase subunit E [Bradymonadales bacterium]